MIRVLVAEDMRILRDMLVATLNLEDDMKVVAQVADGTGVVPAALAERPDLAVLDIDMPGITRPPHALYALSARP
jgi:two-component system, NarL family, response regulator DesR